MRDELRDAADKLKEADAHLLVHDLSERCIAARPAMYLQIEFPELSVDVEYNRKGVHRKTLELLEECANYRTRNVEPLVVPDVIRAQARRRRP